MNSFLPVIVQKIEKIENSVKENGYAETFSVVHFGFRFGDRSGLHGAQINSIQATLNEIALELGLNKVLIIHHSGNSTTTRHHCVSMTTHFLEHVAEASDFQEKIGCLF